jgi:hypothetical protein
MRRKEVKEYFFSKVYLMVDEMELEALDDCAPWKFSRVRNLGYRDQLAAGTPVPRSFQPH